MTAGPVTAGLPLSFPQEQLWLLEKLAPGTYNEVWVLRIRGPLRLDALQEALDGVVARHEVLRSTFHVADQVAVCRPLPHLRLALGEPVDLGTVEPAERDAMVAGIVASVADPPYDLSTGPLLRAAMLRHDAAEHVLVLATHHMIADGWSLRVLLNELLGAYGDIVAGRPVSWPELPAQYSDFAREQRAEAGDGSLAEEEAYWREQLAGVTTAVHLGPSVIRPRVKAATGRRTRIDLPPALAPKLRAFAVRTRSTPAAVLLTAFAVVVHRYTGRDDFLIGTANTGRPDEQYEPLIGFFANTLPLRLRPAPEQTFAGFLRQVMEVSLDALDHDRLPFARLVDAVGANRDRSLSPLVQLTFSHAETAATTITGAGLTVTQKHVPRGRSRFDLVVEAQTDPGAITFWVEHDDVLLPPGFVQGLFEHLRNVVAAVLEDEHLPLAAIPMLTVAERARVIFEVPPLGAPSSAREVVLTDGDLVAPTGVRGRLVTVNPRHVRLDGDRLCTTDGTTLPAGPAELGRYEPDGVVTNLGPAERLPAIGGLTVPLDEVAAALSVHPGVRAATVTTAGPAGPVTARVVPAGPLPPEVAELSAFLQARLPRYCVPDEIIGAAADDPGDDLLALVREVWATVIDRSEVDPDDDFFALGGHSMLAARTTDELRHRLGRPVPLRWLFECPTPRELALRLARPGPARRTTEAPPAPVAADPAAGAPLTAAQSQIWVLDRLAPSRPTYHSPIRVRIDGPLDIGALRRAFAAVVERHDALRTLIRFEVDRPVQYPGSTGPRLETVNLDGLPSAERAAEIDRLALRQVLRPFDLATEPGLRATLVPGHDRAAHLLLLTVHHMVMDGVSFEVFSRDLSAAYNAVVVGGEPRLPHLPMSWGDYARWEMQWAAGPEPEALRDYWSRQLRDLPVFDVPTPLVRPSSITFDGAQRSLLTEPGTARLLRTAAAAFRVSPFTVLATAQALVLGRRAGQDEGVLGAVTDNRRLPGGSGLIGCTVNTAVLRLDCRGDQAVSSLWQAAQRTVTEAYAHQGLPFPELVRAAGQPRLPGRLPLFQVGTEWHEPEATGWDLTGCRADWSFGVTGTARNDLYFTTSPRGDRLELAVELNTNLWTGEAATGLLEEIRDVLTAMLADPNAAVATVGH
ncbi:condensation domain-containing protein [Paractinoplanes hotanensis]|uniref:Condensation domain-containing protein n=1 Tax=Paractinoplanes hotanensis TaxID=2906497 RepID=A0ABT0YBC1_9ACTN|nr:condensation domain-containing protein [Actinoplanes hotanensis]MCM4083100.1 condensation domain-containing protein [Actinoplanes hotanensis]